MGRRRRRDRGGEDCAVIDAPAVSPRASMLRVLRRTDRRLLLAGTALCHDPARRCRGADDGSCPGDHHRLKQFDQFHAEFRLRLCRHVPIRHDDTVHFAGRVYQPYE